MANVRSLFSKVDELDVVAQLNSVHVISVTETWLTDVIPDRAVDIHDFTLMRKDRQHCNKSTGGGICAYIHHSIPADRLPDLETPGLETLWIHIKPYRLPRHTTTILIGVIYHPPSAMAEDNESLIEHITANVDFFLNKYPDAFVALTGDFNPCSTNISLSTITRRCGLTQLVKVPTRGNNILDWCLVNKPTYFNEPIQLPNIGSSDHSAILIKPKDANLIVKPRKKSAYKREMKDSNLRAFGRWICNNPWREVLNQGDCEVKFNLFHEDITYAINTYLPLKKQKTSDHDKPWLSNKLKLLISKRQSALAKYGKQSCTFKMWRNKVQVEARSCKETYYNNKVHNIKDHNISKWWKEVKRLGYGASKTDWCEHLLGESADTIQELAENINNFFVNLSATFQPLEPDSNNLVDCTPDMLVDPYKAYCALKKTKCHKSVGPDEIPNRILRDFAFELSPVISDIYNSSLRQGKIPEILKSSFISPIPKCAPPKTIEDDLRPISLTPQIAKIMESFALESLISDIGDKIDPYQFAIKGRSTTQALVFLLHNVLEALDRGGCSVRAFFADFSKGFDLVDHNILIAELEKLDVRPAIVRWIRAFLTGRKQCVRIRDKKSSYKYPNGGIPQGTKLGPILFAVLVNSLLRDWNFRIKFVDDLSIVEIVPRCSPSITSMLINDISEYASTRGMRLNPKKCKEMIIDFLQYRLPFRDALQIGETTIETVSSYKLLGVYLSNDLLWNVHCDYIVKKANKRLYILRVLKKARVGRSQLLTVYCSLIRPILEYAVPVWSSIPDYLSLKVERVQKRALRIILPGLSYEELLHSAGLETLEKRRNDICKKFASDNKLSGPLKKLFNYNRTNISHEHNLRYIGEPNCLNYINTDRFLNFITCKY